MLQFIRSKVQTAGAVVLEGAALALSASGTAAALIFGRFLLAVALGAFALGVFFRLSSRRRQGQAIDQQDPAWLAPVTALITMIECAVLVEATDLPVRFSQPGFQVHHWLWVLAFLGVAYVVQSRMLRRISSRRWVTE